MTPGKEINMEEVGIQMRKGQKFDKVFGIIVDEFLISLNWSKSFLLRSTFLDYLHTSLSTRNQKLNPELYCLSGVLCASDNCFKKEIKVDLAFLKDMKFFFGENIFRALKNVVNWNCSQNLLTKHPDNCLSWLWLLWFSMYRSLLNAWKGIKLKVFYIVQSSFRHLNLTATLKVEPPEKKRSHKTWRNESNEKKTQRNKNVPNGS